MIPLSPFNAFVLALVAGAGWHIGFSAVQTAVNIINLWITKRNAKRERDAEDLRVAKVMAATAKIPEPAKVPQKPATRHELLIVTAADRNHN